MSWIISASDSHRDRIDRDREIIRKMSPHELTKWLKWGPKRSLYWYQADHVKQMILNGSKPTDQRHGMILADEMGLGKTLQSLSVAAALEEMYPGQPPALFIVPKSVLDAGQWVDEALRNTRWISEEIFLYHGSTRAADLTARIKFLKETNKKRMDLRVGETLSSIQNLMQQSPTSEKVVDIIKKYVDDEGLFSKIQEAFDQFKDPVALYKNIMSSVWNYRSRWNPKKKIKLIFTTQGSVLSEGHSFMKGQPIGSLFYDEAHDIRNGVKANKINGKHKTSKAMFNLSDRVRNFKGKRYPVFALSGTPIFNDYDDLISILHFIGQGPECKPSYFQDESSRKTRLAEAKKKYFIRGLAADVLDLPEKYVCTHFFHFSKREVGRASALMQQLQMLSVQRENADGTEKRDLQMLMQALLTRMRQQCLSEELITGSAKIEYLYKKAYELGEPLTDEEQKYILSTMENSTKLFHFIQDIYKRSNGRFVHPTSQMETTDGELVIVTSEWVRALRLIALMIHCPTVTGKYLGANFKAPLLFMYHGGMNGKKKKQVLDACKESASRGIPSVLLLSFHAGATGLNLFFSRSIMVLEGWWNKALMDQMACRVHRNGQTRSCDIHQYVVEGTIEQHILCLQDSKHFMAMDVYGNEKEKRYAKEQHQKRGGNKKGFRMKEAVANMKKIRQQYAQETQNYSLLNKGFRSKVEVVQPAKELRKTHTLKALQLARPNVRKPAKPASFAHKKSESRKRGRSCDNDTIPAVHAVYAVQQQGSTKPKRTKRVKHAKKEDLPPMLNSKGIVQAGTKMFWSLKNMLF